MVFTSLPFTKNRFKNTFLNNESKHPCNQLKQHLRRETAVSLRALLCCTCTHVVHAHGKVVILEGENALYLCIYPTNVDHQYHLIE